MRTRQLIVIGGGAAGFFCAVNAARLNKKLKVVILEKSGKLLSKVKVSGGGRCNITHHCTEIDSMIRHYPRGTNFLRKAFYHFFTSDTIEWFSGRAVPLITEADGRMFPASHSSQSVIDCLLREADLQQVTIRTHKDVKSISRNEAGFTLVLGDDTSMESDFVCVAAGGLLRETGNDWLTQTGHSIIPPLPSLFSFNMPSHPITALQGISVADASVRIAGSKWQQRAPLLITHWGLSGPAVLKLSAWAARELAGLDYRFQIMVNWAPDYNEQTLYDFFQMQRTERAGQETGNKNALGLPSRLWHFLLESAGIATNCRWSDLKAKDQRNLCKTICTYSCNIQGKTRFKEEFVTAGGIDLKEINPQTMESRKMPGLYFAGEIMDVDGITGGFNFQHAWTSGFIAAKAIAGAADQQNLPIA